MPLQVQSDPLSLYLFLLLPSSPLSLLYKPLLTLKVLVSPDVTSSLALQLR